MPRDHLDYARLAFIKPAFRLERITRNSIAVCRFAIEPNHFAWICVGDKHRYASVRDTLCYSICRNRVVALLVFYAAD